MPNRIATIETRRQLTAMGTHNICAYINRDRPKPTLDSIETLAQETVVPEEQEEEQEVEVGRVEVEEEEEGGEEGGERELYVKCRGKGKGTAVYFDNSRSSITQIYEMAAQKRIPVPVFSPFSTGPPHCPSFTVKVYFHSLTVVSPAAESIKQAKELACSLIVHQLVHLNH